jgi:hypothetical protein
MKMWGEEKPTRRRDIIKKAAQVRLEVWTMKKQPMEVSHGHQECPKKKQLTGVTHDQLEVWSTRSVKRNMPTTAVVQGQLEVWTRRSTAHDQLEVWSKRRRRCQRVKDNLMCYQGGEPQVLDRATLVYLVTSR